MSATDAVFIGGLTSLGRVELRRGARWPRRHRRWSACNAQRRRHRRCRPSCLDVSDDRACVRHRSPLGNAAQAHLSGPTRSEAALGWFQPPRLSCPLGKATGGSLIHSLSPPALLRSLPLKTNSLFGVRSVVLLLLSCLVPPSWPACPAPCQWARAESLAAAAQAGLLQLKSGRNGRTKHCK